MLRPCSSSEGLYSPSTLLGTPVQSKAIQCNSFAKLLRRLYVFTFWWHCQKGDYSTLCLVIVDGGSALDCTGVSNKVLEECISKLQTEREEKVSFDWNIIKKSSVDSIIEIQIKIIKMYVWVLYVLTFLLVGGLGAAGDIFYSDWRAWRWLSGLVWKGPACCSPTAHIATGKGCPGTTSVGWLKRSGNSYAVTSHRMPWIHL